MDAPAERRAELSATLLAAGRSLGNSSSMLVSACADRLGIHSTDWGCVLLLAEADPEPLTAGQLAELTGLTTGAVTGVLDRCEKAGFLRRERDPSDRRRVIVRLVPEAMTRIQPMFDGMIADMLALQRDYSDDELAVVLDVITRASEILRAHARRIRRGD
ncbi:MAG TPA: MarR family transcriptional regulator [Acidimicrobiales bacterium]|nr:MarR family transcriptional regulator [Acidimicrobiales bacterium]